jgi:hypothetical protein
MKMARKLYDLAVKTGEYKNQSGEMKGRWQNVGACMQSDDGSKFLMLAKWFNPAGVQDSKGGESILLSMFPPKEQGAVGQPQSQGQQQMRQPSTPTRQAPAVNSSMDDDIPF